jgi:hypothetical protein
LKRSAQIKMGPAQDLGENGNEKARESRNVRDEDSQCLRSISVRLRKLRSCFVELLCVSPAALFRGKPAWAYSSLLFASATSSGSGGSAGSLFWSPTRASARRISGSAARTFSASLFGSTTRPFPTLWRARSGRTDPPNLSRSGGRAARQRRTRRLAEPSAISRRQPATFRRLVATPREHVNV